MLNNNIFYILFLRNIFHTNGSFLINKFTKTKKICNNKMIIIVKILYYNFKTVLN